MIVKGVPPKGWNEGLGELATIYHTLEYAEYLRKEGVGVWHSTSAKALLWSKPRFFGLLNCFSSVYLSSVNAESAMEIADFLKGKRVKISVHPLAKDEGELVNAGFKETKWATFLIDLTKDKDELWNKVNKSARKLVRRTLENGVTVRQINDAEEFDGYQRLVNENRRRNKVKEYPYSRAWWDCLVSNGLGRVFVAELDGELLGGLSVSLYNGYVNEWGAALSDKAREEKIYASDAIRWSVIEWAKVNGARYYDLTGVNPSPKNAKEEGIYRFKEKWGGTLYKYSEYSLSNSFVDLAKKLARC